MKQNVNGFHQNTAAWTQRLLYNEDEKWNSNLRLPRSLWSIPSPGI